ncbi:hypothetical protein SAMN06273570_4952 [Candidatus Pantoea floridensis]|uniref:Uncharacterized protein n=1 Tax=Candidatus Pantoea floridensis TaxID=1938870 RepID=A0A286DR09_9GAMM|nr:hypothetical protein BX596_5093 [Enterobacteriaceae bacterium JKS000233]SOD61117.1 hypothetical protein SAMN06273570_4952 [Pantoea floridensis]
MWFIQILQTHVGLAENTDETGCGHHVHADVADNIYWQGLDALSSTYPDGVRINQLSAPMMRHIGAYVLRIIASSHPNHPKLLVTRSVKASRSGHQHVR